MECSVIYVKKYSQIVILALDKLTEGFDFCDKSVNIRASKFSIPETEFLRI